MPDIIHEDEYNLIAYHDSHQAVQAALAAQSLSLASLSRDLTLGSPYMQALSVIWQMRNEAEGSGGELPQE